MAVATWFLIGYLSEEGGTDHIVEIPQLGRPVEIFLGAAAALIALRAGWRFFGPSRSWLIDEGWWRVYVRLLGCGVFLAAGARIVTAGSSGANIGGGMLLLVGPLLLLYLWGRAREEAIRVRSAAPPGWTPSAFGPAFPQAAPVDAYKNRAVFNTVGIRKGDTMSVLHCLFARAQT